MNIPDKVKAAAHSLVERYGDHVEHLGKYQGAEAFYYHFPDEEDAGFPFVYLLKNDNVTEISGFDALRIIGLYFKD
ncbi:MAG: hypothetical protein HUK14_04880 [Muribaculaceae bacterium]|nr:hypothetical protein [Muribaculaceae bacterium]